jgi:hypothetical protein
MSARPLRRAGAFLLAGVLVGCHDVATAPRTPRSAVDRVPAPAAREDDRMPNAVRYRDAGHRPVTGRSGGAVVTARALLGRDGLTALEVVAGEPDATPSGVLRKVQVKVFAADGALRGTRNHVGLDAADTVLTIGGLARETPLQVQANVQVAGVARTGVVTVREVVKLRPDLAVTAIGAPASAMVGMPTIVTAVIHEGNGDVGARTTCALDADGVPVDSASGIWVDAGGMVSCELTHVFATAGTHALAVRLARTDPRDDDPSNDVATASVVVITEVRMAATSYVVNDSFHMVRSGTEQFYGATTPQGPRYYEAREWSYTNTGRGQSARLDASTAEPVTFPDEPLRELHFEMRTGGATIAETTLDSLTVHDVRVAGDTTIACGRQFTSTTIGTTLVVCRRRAASTGSTTTLLMYSWSASDVTYISVESESVSCIAPVSCSPGSWHWNTTSRTVTGTPVVFGPDFALSGAFGSGDGRFVADVRVPMEPSHWGYTVPNTCRSWNDYRAGQVGRAYTCEGETNEWWSSRGVPGIIPGTALLVGG